MYKFIFPDGYQLELEYEEMVQIFFGSIWTKTEGDEHWSSAKEKVSKIKLHIPATDY